MRCAQALSLGDNWSIHHKRGKVWGHSCISHGGYTATFVKGFLQILPTHLAGMRADSFLFMPMFNIFLHTVQYTQNDRQFCSFAV
jgi:hypothetical protein